MECPICGGQLEEEIDPYLKTKILICMGLVDPEDAGLPLKLCEYYEEQGA